MASTKKVSKEGPSKPRAEARKPARTRPGQPAKSEESVASLFTAKGPSSGKEARTAAASPEIRALLNKAKDKGFVTMDEVNEALPDEAVSSEQIDEVLDLFYKSEIEILDRQSPSVRSAASKLRRMVGADVDA